VPFFLYNVEITFSSLGKTLRTTMAATGRPFSLFSACSVESGAVGVRYDAAATRRRWWKLDATRVGKRLQCSMYLPVKPRT
jgi:hypothetical protein